MVCIPYLHRLGVIVIAASLTILLIGRLANQVQSQAEGEVSGELKKWYPVTVDFTGPNASEMDNTPNPFLDYRLQVTFSAPSGRSYNVPGFFDGDGNGNGIGSVWRVRFTPDEVGTWQYTASFRMGTNIAVDLRPDAGSTTGFDGASGTFFISQRDRAAPGFLKWGRLEYVGTHYLKFRDGPYWIKGGANSPETLLGYSDFDNTTAGPYGLLDFENHKQDWNAGDPEWANGRGRGIIGALNYFQETHINSVYFLPMNIGGDGQNTWPYAGTVNARGSATNDNEHFDISKMRQWDIVFRYAQRKGVMLHFVLNEAEKANKNELDDATLGVERKLFYRELVARFGHNNALQWNISEEYDYKLPLSPDTVMQFAGYIQSVDPYGHPITVHNNADPDTAWTPFLGDPRLSITSFQYPGSRAFPYNVARYGAEVEEWRNKTASAGRPLPIGMDELRATTTTNIDDQRKELLWPTYLSGGQIEHYIGGGDIDKTLDDFRPYETLWNYTWYARKFMEENLPFWEMQPEDGLLSDESTSFGGGQVFARAGEIYAVYLPDASPSGTLDLSGATATLVLRWYNPRSGQFEGSAVNIAGGGNVSLGAPPRDPSQDWVVLIQRENDIGTPTPTATPNTMQEIVSLPIVSRAGTGVTATPTPTAPATATPSSTSYNILVSSSPDRSNPLPLEGSTVSEKIYVFSSPDTNVERVRFYLDDPEMVGDPRQVEENAPYDFAGGTVDTANPFNTNLVANGSHTITAEILLTNAGTQVAHATFVVDN